MATLAERLKSPTLRRAIKQRRMVLDVTTALEDELNRRKMSMTAFARALGKSKALVSRIFRRQPNLTFFTAVELADVLDLDIKIEVAPRRESSNVIYLHQVVCNGSPPSAATAPATSFRIAETGMAV
jgi:transcriptional regulator with XRE-family HTH domain